MAGTGAQIAGSIATSDAARDWKAIRDAGDIQFAPLPPIEPRPQPQWLEALGRWLRELLEPLGQAIGVSWPVIQIVLIALTALLAVWIVWRLVQPMIERRRMAPALSVPDWSPDRAAAVALLEDADRLAAEGRFGEAAHLLLQRSVHHIAEARPEWLRPASTAREIAGLPMLSHRARSAFFEIAVRVERNLFALRDLSADDWRAARAAYADFALQDIGAGARA